MKMIKINESTINEDITNINDLPFKDDIENVGGKLYSVGGAVRDKFLGKESKDLDILITGIPMNDLETILSKYGKVDSVGKSFGILKFKEFGKTEDIDIAIPRTERASGDGGHKGFEISSDHKLPIEKDLERRDFTINAIAQSLNGDYIDPYKGREDLQNKIIRVVNPEAFSDDPLRMLRAVQFSSRFNFDIEPNTFKMIKNNSYRVKELPSERILTEFDKIVKKGDVSVGAKLLIETGLYEHIFGKNISFDSSKGWDKVRNMGEFIFLLIYNVINKPSDFFKNKLGGDIENFKIIKGLEVGFDTYKNNKQFNRLVAFKIYSVSVLAFESELLPFQDSINDLKSGKYPKEMKELAINGNEIMELGFTGKEIGDLNIKLVSMIMIDKLPNNKESIVEYIKNEYKK